MKFTDLYPDTKPLENQHDSGQTKVQRGLELSHCRACGTLTDWFDITRRVPVCSEECQQHFTTRVDEIKTRTALVTHFERYRQDIAQELACAEQYQSATKDILIPVYGQLNYLRVCVESIQQTTEQYHLYIWDNGSDIETEQYLRDLMFRHPDEVDVMRSETNLGFIEPNNRMAEWGDGEYIILLNSDTKVLEGWDRAMLGFLQKHPDVAQVGYLGGRLDADGKGGRIDFGYDVDYIMGFCSCFPRAVYEKTGLFDPGYQFAYCEDADFSIRLQEAKWRIYALHLLLVHHYENKTIKAVHGEGQIDVTTTFEKNHVYLRQKCADYLSRKRADVRQN